jgi:dipeptide/tripeptide permease
MPMNASESVLRFLLLPHQVYIILLLEFLNSFRSFGLRFVLYNYMTNEFGIGDGQAGALLGIKGFVDIGE